MLIKPSVAELLEKVDNRYMLVIATARRARQIAQGAEVLVKTENVAPVSIAADEIVAGKVTVCLYYYQVLLVLVRIQERQN